MRATSERAPLGSGPVMHPAQRARLWGPRAAAADGFAGATWAWPGGDGPASGARSQVTAIPADIGARAAAVGDHQSGRQANTAHPATLDTIVPLVGRIRFPRTSHASSPPGPTAAALAN